eukprot:scaffold13447_cov59-Attheya_sp.AAC.6
MYNELGRRAQGWGKNKGTDTMFFIERGQIPQGRKATYVKAVCDIRPPKEETHRVRLTAGGNLIDYPGNVSTPPRTSPPSRPIGIVLFPTMAANTCV